MFSQSQGNNLKIGKYRNYQAANTIYPKSSFKSSWRTHKRYLLLLVAIEAIKIHIFLLAKLGGVEFREVHSTLNLLACAVLMFLFNGKRYFEYYGYRMFILSLFPIFWRLLQRTVIKNHAQLLGKKNAKQKNALYICNCCGWVNMLVITHFVGPSRETEIFTVICLLHSYYWHIMAYIFSLISFLRRLPCQCRIWRCSDIKLVILTSQTESSRSQVFILC